MLLWALCFPLITVGIEFVPHLTFAALRALLAGLALTTLALFLRRPIPRDRKIWTTLTIVGTGATSLGFLGMFHASEFISPGIATVIASTQPLLAAVLAGIFLNERLNSRGKLGLALGFTGILIITWPQLVFSGQKNYAIGVLYVVLAALGITVSNVMIKRVVGNVDVLMAMGLQMLIGSIPLVVAAWTLEEPLAIQWSFEFLGVLLTLSLLGTSLVYWLWFSILDETPLNQANAFSFLIPIFGLTIGALFYDESFGWSTTIGVAFTIVGVSLVTFQGARVSNIASE